MKKPNVHALDTNVPGITDALLFRSKATLLQLRRGLRELTKKDIRRFPLADLHNGYPIIAETRTPLWAPGDEGEQSLVAGKIHNLRLAVRRLNGVEVPAGGTFSFWEQLGRTSRLKGYVNGRELREGCLIPTIGGGLCQLSNALYDAALRADFQIIERHAHTQVIPGSLAEIGRDATVFWNYVDLRFRSDHSFRIEAKLTDSELVVRYRSARRGPRRLVQLSSKRMRVENAADCFSCGKQDCFRHGKAVARESNFGRSAYLLDEYWPEFDRYITNTKRPVDTLGIPIDGKRFGKTSYDWTTSGFRTVSQQRLFTLHRSYQSRKLSLQGASRQRAWLAANERLAQCYVSLLSYDVTHVTVMQQLLPYLWREGHLGGRTFDVLMTALPLDVLQHRLDEAFALHPESPTLNDFRSDTALVESESSALRQARRIITPHSEIASLFPEKALLLDWSIPAVPVGHGREAVRFRRLVFPASTAGRKGAYELRSSLVGLRAQLTITGPVLEGGNFWTGFEVERRHSEEEWLRDAAAVVLPAYIEHHPRRLLEAVAQGVPVIASTACGLSHVKGVTSVAHGDVESLRREIEKVTGEPASRLAVVSNQSVL
jgi:hypothetical protein